MLFLERKSTKKNFYSIDKLLFKSLAPITKAGFEEKTIYNKENDDGIL